MSNISWMYKNHAETAQWVVDTLGHPYPIYGTANLADNNLQSYFRGGTHYSSARFVMSFGSAIYVDTIIAIHNLNRLTGNNGTFTIFAGNSYPPSAYQSALPVVSNYGTSVKYFNSPIAYRYFEFWASGTQGIPDGFVRINEVFIGKRITLSVNPEYPFRNELIESNIINKSDNGNNLVYNKYERLKWDFNYPLLGISDHTSLQNIRNYCNGGFKPFFICIDKDYDPLETFFVRFTKNSWKDSEITSFYNDISFSIEEEK